MKMYLIRVKGSVLCYGRGTLHRTPTLYPPRAAKGLLTKLRKRGQVAQVFKRKKPDVYPATELELVPVHAVDGEIIVEIRENEDAATHRLQETIHGHAEAGQ